MNAFSLHIITSCNFVVLNLMSSQCLLSIRQGFALKLPYVSGLWSCVFLRSLRFLQQSSDTLTATSSPYRTRKGKAPVMLMVCGRYRRFTEEHLASCSCVVIRYVQVEQTYHLMWTQWTITCTTLLNAQKHTPFKSTFYIINVYVAEMLCWIHEHIVYLTFTWC